MNELMVAGVTSESLWSEERRSYFSSGPAALPDAESRPVDGGSLVPMAYVVTAWPPGRRLESYVCGAVHFDGPCLTLGEIRGQPGRTVQFANVPVVVRRVARDTAAPEVEELGDA